MPLPARVGVRVIGTPVAAAALATGRRGGDDAAGDEDERCRWKLA
jgi:hypothetical protein